MFVPSGQTAAHQRSHRPQDAGSAGFGAPLVVTAQTPAGQEPGKDSFHDPAAGQDRKTGDVVTAADDVEDEAEMPGGPILEVAGVTAVGPDPRQPPQAGLRRCQQDPGGVQVGRGGRPSASRLPARMPPSPRRTTPGRSAAGVPAATGRTARSAPSGSSGAGHRPAWSAPSPGGRCATSCASRTAHEARHRSHRWASTSISSRRMRSDTTLIASTPSARRSDSRSRIDSDRGKAIACSSG